jgi:hypothetical protein
MLTCYKLDELVDSGGEEKEYLEIFWEGHLRVPVAKTLGQIENTEKGECPCPPPEAATRRMLKTKDISVCATVSCRE